MEALSGPPGCVFADDPVEVVVPAEPPEPEPVCDDPDAEVVVVALLGAVGVGVGVPVGLALLAWLLEFPEDWLLAVEVPCEVLELPAPEPWAPAEPVLVGEAAVFEPVCVVAAPVLGVEPVEEPPAWALDVLPVEADDDEPPVPPEVAEVEVFVEVEALADPPVAVEVGVGAGVGVEVGVGLAGLVDEGVGVGLAGVGVGLADVGGGASVAGHD